VTVNTITVGPGALTIGAAAALTNFSGQITQCTLKPKIEKEDPINVLSGEQVPGDRTESFTLDGTLLQDFGAASSTTEWLWEHRGQTHDFKYTPSTAGGRTITGRLEVEPIDIGGEVKKKPTSEFSFALSGAPIFGAIAGA
jgi:hypothetical protein